MPGLYGRPQKYVRHTTQDVDVEIEPQRYRIIPFWYADTGATARSDGQDLETKNCPIGSRISRHKVEMVITPETIEPQKVYMGMVKLSFHDVQSPFVSGTYVGWDTFKGTPTEDETMTSYIRIFPNDDYSLKKCDFPTSNVDISDDINAVRLDDNFKHFIQLKKPLVIYDQQPLISDRYMKVPAKVKRINPFTFYGLWIWNDSARGATPADTSVYLTMKQYFEEYAL